MILAGLLVGFGVAAWADLPTRRWRISIERPFPHRSLAEMTVFSLMDFAQPVPIICILTAVYLLDRRGFPIVIHCLWALLLATLLFGALKLTVGRHRPSSFMPSAAATPDARPEHQKRWSDTWVGVRIRGRTGANMSFPSAHTAGAFAYGLVLAWFYPRLRWMFYLLAAGCGAGRFFSEFHWLTDIYVGALIGTAAAYLSLRPWLYVDPLARLTGRQTG